MIAEWDTECLYNCTAYVADQRLNTQSIYNDVHNTQLVSHEPYGSVYPASFQADTEMMAFLKYIHCT